MHAVIEATVQRTRPVILTALAAVLAFIPLTHSVFWGSMAYNPDRRHGGRHGAVPAVPSCALCCVFSDQADCRSGPS